MIHNRMFGRRSGQSLIEILVAIALLIIGVFAVLRLFPPGFKMLARTGYEAQVQTLADNLAQTARNGNLQAPDGIVERVALPGNNPGWYIPNEPYTQALMSAGYEPSVPPDPLNQSSMTGAMTAPANLYDRNSLYVQRTVMGERFALKATGEPSLLLLGPLYMPANGPIDDWVQVYEPNAYSEALVPNEAQLVQTPGNIPARNYAVDYGNGMLAVSPFDPDFNTDRHYLLSYRTVLNNMPVDIVDERVTIAAGQTTVQAFVQGHPLYTLDANKNPIGSSVQLYRAFPSGDGTNGTFKLLDVFAGVIQVQPYSLSFTDANGYTQYATIIAPNATLAVDYTVRDWQIQRVDRDVPGDGVVHLPVNNLDVLDRNFNPMSPTRVLVVNLNNPTQMIPIGGQAGQITAPGAAAAPPSVNVRDGIVYMPPTWPDNSPTPGTPVRIYYALFNTWAQQPSISYRTYTLSPNAMGNPAAVAPVGPGYRYFSLTFGSDAISNLAVLHFTVADLGKTVSIDYRYIDPNGGVQQILGKPYRIQPAALSNGLPTDAQAALRYKGNGTVLIDRVQGISYQARGIFVDTGDIRRADDPQLLAAPQSPIWTTKQNGRLGEATEDVYVAR